MDGDGTYPPEAIPALIDELPRAAGTSFRLPLSAPDPAAMGPTNPCRATPSSPDGGAALQAQLRDSQSGMWVFRRALLDRMQLVSTGMAFSQRSSSRPSRRGARPANPITYGLREGEV
jgi:hypothetical protein